MKDVEVVDVTTEGLIWGGGCFLKLLCRCEKTTNKKRHQTTTGSEIDARFATEQNTELLEFRF